MTGKLRGQGNAGIIKAYLVSPGEPKYREVCVGPSSCVAVETCADVPRALSVLGIVDPDLAEFVMRAVCGATEQ
jgi:hypothetical protein